MPSRLRLTLLVLAATVLLAVACLAAACRAGEPPRAELGPVSRTAWAQWLVGVRVHFVAFVSNPGPHPIELSDIRYQMRSPSGALVESGSVPQSYPRRIAPGQVAVIGRTVTADTAERTEDVATVTIEYKTRTVASADNLLTVVKVEFRGADDTLQALVVGEVRNDGSKRYDNIKVAAALLDDSGQPIGFATARLPVDSLGPGESAQFVTHADLQAGMVEGGVNSVRVFAFDQ